MFDLGYKQGVTLVTTMAHKLRALTEAAAALGVMVVGAMISTMVGVKFGAITAFGNTFDLQVLANKILPNFGAVLLVGLCYWLLGRKGMNSNKLLGIVIAIALVLGWFKLLII
jgi:PTS system mannose-specific IID component